MWISRSRIVGSSGNCLIIGRIARQPDCHTFLPTVSSLSFLPLCFRLEQDSQTCFSAVPFPIVPFCWEERRWPSCKRRCRRLHWIEWARFWLSIFVTTGAVWLWTLNISQPQFPWLWKSSWNLPGVDWGLNKAAHEEATALGLPTAGPRRGQSLSPKETQVPGFSVGEKDLSQSLGSR